MEKKEMLNMLDVTYDGILKFVWDYQLLPKHTLISF